MSIKMFKNKNLTMGEVHVYIDTGNPITRGSCDKNARAVIYQSGKLQTNYDLWYNSL